MKPKGLAVLLLLFLVLGLLTHTVQAVEPSLDARREIDLSTHGPRKIAEQTATHVVRGMISNITSFWENGSIYSLAELKPQTWLKGRTAQTSIFIKFEGGRVENIELLIDHGFRFKTGEITTVFLEQVGGQMMFQALWKEEAATSGATSTSSEPGGWGYLYTHPLYWKNPDVLFTLNRGNPPATPNRGTLDISGDAEWDGVLAAIDTWNRADSTLRFSSTFGSCDILARDGVNCISWVPSLPGNAIALTGTWTDFLDGTLIGADVRFNDEYFWSLNPIENQLDVQGVATHELGHAVHLDDLTGDADGLQTMMQNANWAGLAASTGTLRWRSLFWGDIAGVRYVHPRQYTVSPGQWIGDFTDGGDAVLANLGGDRYPELVFLWVDADPAGPNKIYYRIGWDINLRSVGEVGIWMTGEVEKSGWVGDDTQGAGVAVADINRNGLQDLLIAWVNNLGFPEYDNDIHYQIAWDLIGETPSSWSPVFFQT